MRNLLRFYRLHFLRRLWFLPCTLVWTFFALNGFFAENNVIAFVDPMETGLMIPAFVPCIFLFQNSAEIEFSQCYGFPLRHLCLAYSLPYYLYSLVGMVGAVWLFPLDLAGVTAQGRWIILLTGAVNLTFAVVLAVFVRLVVRNLFGALGLSMVLFYGFILNLYSPSYPGAYYRVGNPLTAVLRYGLPMEKFYWNRAVYIGLILLLCIINYLILRQRQFKDSRD